MTWNDLRTLGHTLLWGTFVYWEVPWGNKSEMAGHCRKCGRWVKKDERGFWGAIHRTCAEYQAETYGPK